MQKTIIFLLIFYFAGMTYIATGHEQTGVQLFRSIDEVPHHEDFSDADLPDLPDDWSKIVQTSSTGGIDTHNFGGPNSPPNHVRFRNMVDINAQLILISPKVNLDLSQLRVRFFSKSQIGQNNAIEIGTIADPNNLPSYNHLQTFDLTTDYQEFTYSFVDYDGDHEYIAFRADLPELIETIYFDDFLLEDIPDSPIMLVTPEQHDFGQVQTGNISAQQDFTITNTGEGVLVLEPEDITLAGSDPLSFLLDNLAETVELHGGESTFVSVSFSPDFEGEHNAYLDIDGFEVPLAGEGIDATITDFPWIEDFTGTESGNIPIGWIRDSNNWRVTNTDGAGGQPPELRFIWNPVVTGKFYVYTPQMNTSGYDELMLSFKHHVNNYADPGEYTLSVWIIDQEDEHLVIEWVDPENIPAEEYWTILNSDDHAIGNDNIRLAFLFDGYSGDIRDWHLDDIMIAVAPDMYVVNFWVKENSPGQPPIEDAEIVFDAYVDDIFTDENGLASIQLIDGTYSATINRAGYESEEVVFNVDGQDKDIDIFLTDLITVPVNLHVDTESVENGEALFSWEHPADDPYKTFVSYNIFLDDPDEPYDSTEAQEYLFSGLETGEYTAGVQAIYTTGSSDIATIGFDLEVIDIPVMDIPWSEDFEGVNTGDIPEGWIRTAENWAVINTSNAGGEPPEMRFYYLPATEGTLYLRTPFLNTNGMEEAWLSFRTYINNFDTPGIYSLKIVSIAEGEEYLIHEWQDPEDIPAHLSTHTLTSHEHGIGSDSLQLAWIFEGNTSDIIWWNIDDILVSDENDTGISQYDEPAFKVYPNPAIDHIQIVHDDIMLNVKLLNMMGREIMEVKPGTKNHTIDISAMQPGFYLLQVKTSGGSFTGRVHIIE